MKLRNLLVGAVAAVATVLPSPAFAVTTYELIETVRQSGIKVTINSERCNGTFYGSYQFHGMARTMNLCPGDTIDAVDHETVRHETWHAIQHCINTMRGTPANTPVVEDVNELAEVVNESLSEYTVSQIKSSYPTDHWLIEFEAYVAEKHLTNEQLQAHFVDACTSY